MVVLSFKEVGFCEGYVGFEFGVLHLAEFGRERERERWDF